MRKIMKRILICLTISTVCWGILLVRDRQTLGSSLIRFHVVANSDSPEDQSVKLAVRDAVLADIQSDMQNITSKEAAVQYLEESIPKLQELANRTLRYAGVTDEAVVTVCREAFPVRHYDTFSLPSGVYDTLRIVIGEGEGKNWWCVTFPSLCMGASVEGYEAAAAGAGFSGSLRETLNNGEDHRFRFYMLDCLGKQENRIFEK